MSENVPKCFLEAAGELRHDTKRKDSNIFGKPVSDDPQTGTRLIRCSVEGCRATALVAGPPQDKRPLTEIAEEIYQAALPYCVKRESVEQ